MTEVWIALGLLSVAAVGWYVRGGGAKGGSVTGERKKAASAESNAPVGSSVAAPAEPRPMPEALAALKLRSAARLAPEKVQWFEDALRRIPRPPRALHQLASLDFIAQASSSELADVVMSEPLVAAKVLAKAHSPIYGLREPVTKVGQAITYLGTNSVRNVCLRYLLDESFKSDNASIGKVFEVMSEASTLGSELSLRLAQRLRLPDAGGLMTHVLLSFAGHLAATVLQVNARRAVSRAVTVTLLQRVCAQQQDLGLPGSEIGRMLMREWELPPALIDDVADLDQVLVTAVDAWPPAKAALLAVGYLSARLGERLADGRFDDLAALDELLDSDPDFHHLHGYLALPALRELRPLLRRADLFAGLLTLEPAVAD